MKFFSIFLFFFSCSLWGSGQCGNGGSVFKETFGGSFSSVDVGPPLTSGSSPYTYASGNIIAAGQYSLRKHTGEINGWADGNDNTGQGGYMMMVRSDLSRPDFYETTVKGLCQAPTQFVCFSAASLSKSGIGRTVVIHVLVTNAATNSLLATFTSPALPNNDVITWGNYSFSYPLPRGTGSVKLLFSLSTSTSSPDDFAIDDIKVTGGGSGNGGNATSDYPNINGRYEYPVFACLNERVTFSYGGAFKNQELQWERMRPDYQYEPIPGATASTYVIDSAKRDDSRFYRLRFADSGYLSSPTCSTPTSPVGLYVDPFPIIETNGPVCEGSPLDIAVNVGTSTNWTGPNGYVASGNRLHFQNSTPQQSGTYTATVFFNTVCLLTVTVKADIVINKNPINLTLPADTAICKGGSLTLDASNPGATYNWSTGDSVSSIVVKKEGIYSVIVYGDKKCSLGGTSTVRIVDRPMVSLRTDTVLCYGDTLLLNPIADNISSYKWSTGAVTPAIKVSEKGIYTLRVANNCGTNTASVNIGFVRCSEELLVPTAFTPNKDGLNDVFRPAQDASISQYLLKIYNRSGQVIFTSAEISKGWDGTINRLPQSMGAYVWVIEYTSKTGKHHSISGTVTLIR